jgi:hypothetical protein
MALKVKFRTQFPALVSVSSPLTLVKTGLAYAFGFDVTALPASLDAYYPRITGSVTFAGFIKSSTATGGIGYGTGAGGAVTQLTSRTTGVTLNTVSGAITLFAAAPAVGTWVSCTVTNSAVAATDTISLSIKSSNAANTYIAHVTLVAAGSFQISFTTVAGTTSDSPVINFNVIKGVIA